MLAALTMSQDVLAKSASSVQRFSSLPECRRILLDQDDDVTSAPDPLSNPQSRRVAVEVSYVA